MFQELVLLQKRVFIKAATGTCSIAWYGKGQGNTQGGVVQPWRRGGGLGLGQEGLNFLFIAGMKLWAGRQAGWLTKSGL